MSKEIRNRNLIGVFFDEKRTQFICNILIKYILPYNLFNRVVLICNSDVSYKTIKHKLANFHETLVILHNNEFAEFGAMSEAISILKNSGELSNSQNIFFNDTVFFNFKSNFINTFYFLLQTQQKIFSNTPYIMGNIAFLGKRGAVFSLPVDKWIQTAIFVMNSEALEKISDDFVGILRNNKIEMNMQNNYSNSFELLNKYFDKDVLSYHVGKWLFAGEWYQSKNFNDFDENKLIQKIESIALEKYLSARLIQHNVQLIRCFNISNSKLFKHLLRNTHASTFKIFYSILKFQLLSVKLK